MHIPAHSGTGCDISAAASVARALVHDHVAAASPALAAVAAIGKDRSCGHQPGAYTVHPAVLDATTHTAAVLSGSQSATNEDQPAVTRIPAALDAFAAQTAGPDQAAGSGNWCCGALDALRPDGSVVTSFGLGAGAAHLAGFTAKVCRKRHTGNKFMQCCNAKCMLQRRAMMSRPWPSYDIITSSGENSFFALSPVARQAQSFPSHCCACPVDANLSPCR
jgi:hypothetical protein